MSRLDFYARLAAIEPAVAQAFLEAIADITSTAQLTVVQDAIERGDFEGVITALRLDPAFFAPLDRQIENAFYQGGVWQMTAIPKPPRTLGLGPLVLRFQGRSPRSERWVKERTGLLISEITDDTRRLVREVVSNGIEQGRNPRATARDLLGKKVGNRRSGGLIGLHSKDARAVSRARGELADPSKIGAYLQRDRRDGRYDGLVKDARENGWPKAVARFNKRNGKSFTPASAREFIAGRYADRLLILRSETIARTETIAAFGAGRFEGIAQVVERGDADPNLVTLSWDATGDKRTRPDHMGMEGQTVRFGQPFTFPDGSRALFPGDNSLGAPGKQVIQCRCYLQVRVDWMAQARQRAA